MSRNLSEKELVKVKKYRKYTAKDFADKHAPMPTVDCSTCQINLDNNKDTICANTCAIKDDIRIQRTIAIKYFRRISEIEDDAIFYDLFRRFRIEDISRFLDEHLEEQDRRSKEYDERRRRNDRDRRDQEWDEECRRRNDEFYEELDRRHNEL